MQPTRQELASEFGILINSDHNLLRGTTVTVESPAVLGDIKIMSTADIGRFTYFGSGIIGKVTKIGRYCCIANQVSIGEDQHAINWLSMHPFQYGGGAGFPWWHEVKNLKGKISRIDNDIIKAPPVIGNDVWIGAFSVVLRGVTIGDGAVIGAGSVVTKDVAPYEIVGGTPAKHIRYRFEPEIIKELLDLQWWNYEMANLDGIPFHDIRAAVAELRRRKDTGLLHLWNGHVVTIKN